MSRRPVALVGALVAPFAALPVLALLVGGCTAGARRSAPTAAIVPAADLPARQRETWERWQQGGAAWELEREAVRSDPELGRFVVDNLVVILVRSYDRSALARAGEGAGPFERAQAELVELAPIAMPVLVEFLRLKDGIVAFLAADTLKRIGAAAIAPSADLLDEAVPETRRRAAELLSELPTAGEGEPQVLQRLSRRVEIDEAWIVRAQAAQTLGIRGSAQPDKAYPLTVLSRALADPDPAVVDSAAKGLAALGEPRAIPALIGALERSAAAGEVKCVQTIQAALRKLTGERRDRNVDEWRRWWRENGARRSSPP